MDVEEQKVVGAPDLKSDSRFVVVGRMRGCIDMLWHRRDSKLEWPSR